MERKQTIDDDVSKSECTSQQDDVNSSTPVVCPGGDHVTDSISKRSRKAEVDVVTSEATDPGTQSSIKSEICSETEHLPNRKRIQDNNAEVGSSKVNEESSSSDSSHFILSEPSRNKGDELMQVEGKHCKKIKLQLDEASVETVGFSSVESVDLQKSDSCSDSKGKIRSSMEQDTCDDFKTGAASKDDTLPGHNAGDVATCDQSSHVFEFDLNEELAADDNPGCSQQSNSGLESVRGPIAVVAKIGVPVGFPKTPLRFEGELGWKRGDTASAFRPAEIKRTIQNLGQSFCCREIDLNIAIATDNSAVEAACLPTTSGSHIENFSVMNGSKQSSRFILDLNSKDEIDEHRRPKREPQGFDLNDAYTDAYPMVQCGQSVPPLEIRAASVTTSRQSNFTNGPRPTYWVDLSAMPGFAHVQQAQPFLVAASPGSQQMQAVVPLQSKFSFATPTAPGGMPTPLYSPIILPSFPGQNGAASVPQMPGTMLAAYPGSVHVLDGARRVNPSGMTNLRPSFILGTGPTSLQNVNHGANIIEYLVPGRNMSVDERMKSVQQVSTFPTSMKRREPDNGRAARPLTIDGLSRGTRIF